MSPTIHSSQHGFAARLNSGVRPNQKIMSLIKFTTDQTVRRLRWVMGGALLFDTLNTLLGQPSTYWQHPAAANEGTPFLVCF